MLTATGKLVPDPDRIPALVDGSCHGSEQTRFSRFRTPFTLGHSTAEYPFKDNRLTTNQLITLSWPSAFNDAFLVAGDSHR